MANAVEIMSIITPILVAVVGMYLRSLLKKIDSIDELKSKVSELTINLSTLNNVKAEWVEMLS